MSLNEMFARMAPGNIATIAGVGYVEGVPAREAPAGWPMGIARNAAGDLFVVDYWGHRIWRIDVDGVLHSCAGQGVPGNSGDGGPAADARFDQPHDLRIDDDGNLYLSDLGNSTIRRIDAATGIITTIAGSGRTGRGGDGGPAVEAELDTHCGIAIDGDGNVYISSEWANNIRRIDARTGIIGRFAGWDARHHPSEDGDSRPASGEALSMGGYHGDGGPADLAGFHHPEHLALDSRGDLYVCDNSNHRIRKIDMESSIVTTVFGNGQAASNGDGGPAVEASVFMPDAIYVDAADNLYVGEKYGFRIRRVDGRTGVVETLVGTGSPGFGEEGMPGPETRCNSCEVGLWADPDGTVLWSDCSGRVRRYDAETGIVTTVLGGTSVHDGEEATAAFLRGPGGISIGPDGRIYIADVWNQRIRAIDPGTGVIRTVAGNGARAHGGDNGPATEAYLGNPHDVSVDARGRVVIADTRHGHVRRVDEDGTIRVVAGAGEKWDRGDGGPAIAANLVHVLSVEHGPGGDIYVGDAEAGRIRRIDASSGIIETVAGTGTPGYSGDGGPAVEARVGAPTAIRFDGAGNLYFSDRDHNVVRKIDGEGIISTIVGTGARGFSEDGTPADRAMVHEPWGMEVSPEGIVYVSDTGNNRVRRVDAAGQLETVAGGPEAGDFGDGGEAVMAGLNAPNGLRLYGDDVLLVSDRFNNKIKAVRLGAE